MISYLLLVILVLRQVTPGLLMLLNVSELLGYFTPFIVVFVILVGENGSIINSLSRLLRGPLLLVLVEKGAVPLPLLDRFALLIVVRGLTRFVFIEHHAELLGC